MITWMNGFIFSNASKNPERATTFPHFGEEKAKKSLWLVGGLLWISRNSLTKLILKFQLNKLRQKNNLSFQINKMEPAG